MSLQLAASNGVSPGIFRLSGRKLVPSPSLHACPDRNYLIQTHFGETS